MIKKLVKLPASAAAFVAAKVMGRGTGPAAEPPAPPPRTPPKAAAPKAAAPKAPAAPKVTVTAEETPNPNARKFVCSKPAIASGSATFNSATEAFKNPVGKAVFAVGGVKSVFVVNDFVTVTKNEDADWGSLTPRLVKAISGALDTSS